MASRVGPSEVRQLEQFQARRRNSAVGTQRNAARAPLATHATHPLKCCRPQCPTGLPMVRVAVPVDWIRYNKTLGTSSCWRSSTPLLDWLLPICCLCSRSRASQPPLSMLPTPPPAAAGSRPAVGFGMVHGHHRRRCRFLRRLKPQPNRCSTAASEIEGGSRQPNIAFASAPLRTLEMLTKLHELIDPRHMPMDMCRC